LIQPAYAGTINIEDIEAYEIDTRNFFEKVLHINYEMIIIDYNEWYN
jgi:hypothetical protein